jgi:zinc protease
MRRRLAILALAATLAGAPAALASPEPVVNYHARVLANGLRVYLVPDRTRARVTVQVFYDVGSEDDPPGRAGLAHLFEHLMFANRRGAPAGYLDELTESAGGESNASTGPRFTEYHDTLSPPALRQVLWAEASRMSGFAIRQVDLDRERTVVQRELAESAGEDGDGLMLVWRTSARGSALELGGDPTGGDTASLRRVSLDDVQRFHDRYYRPDNAVLVVAGDFDASRTDAWIDRYFGAIGRAPGAAPASPPRNLAAVHAAARPHRGPRAGPVVLAVSTPRAGTDDAVILQLVDTLLTEGAPSRAEAALVRPGLASAAFTQLDLRGDGGVYYLGAIPAPGASSRQVEQRLRRLLAGFWRRPVSEAALEAAKNALRVAAYSQRETLEDMAGAVGQAVVLTGSAAPVNRDLAVLSRIRPTDVQSFSRRYLRDAQLVPVRATPSEPPPAVLEAARTRQPHPAREAFAPVWRRRDAGADSYPAGGGVERVQAPSLDQRLLANGLGVAAARSGRVPLATAILVVPHRAGRGGGDQGPPLQLAAEQGAFGCRTAAGPLGKALDGLGLSAEVDVDDRATRVMLTGLSASLRPGLKLLAECIRAPSPAGAEFRRLRRRWRDEPPDAADPDTLTSRAFQRILFGRSAPAHRRGGSGFSRAEFERTRGDLLHPQGAVLILTGDLDPHTAAGWAQDLFGGWTVGRRPLTAAPAAAAPSTRALVADAPGWSLALVSIGARVPAGAYPSRVAFELANGILGGSYTSRLSQDLRIRRGLTYAVSSDIGWSAAGGLFSARAAVDPRAATQAGALMLSDLSELARLGPTARELAKHQALLSASLADAAETSDGLARLLADDVACAEPIGRVFVDAAGIAGTSAAEVRDAAALLARPGTLRLVVVADMRRLPRSFRSGLPSASVVRAEDL